jgi:hypothetical protein
MMMMIRCLMMIVFSLKGLAVLDKHTIDHPGRKQRTHPV